MGLYRLVEFWRGVNNAQHLFNVEIEIDDVKVPVDLREPGTVFFAHAMQRFLASDQTFADLIGAERVIFRETDQRVVDVVVECRCAVTDAPRRVGVFRQFEVVFTDQGGDYILFDPGDEVVKVRVIMVDQI